MSDVVARPAIEFSGRRTCPFSPPPVFRELREEAPVSWMRLPSGDHAWVLTRHEDVRSALTDPRLSSNTAKPGFPTLFEGQNVFADAPPSLIRMDAPEHAVARRAVIGEFTVRRLEVLRPRIQEIVDHRIDEMLSGPRPVDLVQAFAMPVPSLVICDLLDVPYDDHEFFQGLSSRLLSRTLDASDRYDSYSELRSYLDKLVAAKEAAPSDDFLGRQIAKRRENPFFDREYVVSLSILLLVAGHETTANMISLGALALLENPAELAAIRDDPGKTMGAVEELLRYFTIADLATVRLATADLEIGGQRIKAGEGVLALGYAANRDPEAFEDPDELDIDRRARHHVAFGFGAHQCLGQNLARVELQVVFDTLVRRIPDLALAVPVDTLNYKDEALVYGIREMPVTW